MFTKFNYLKQGKNLKRRALKALDYMSRRVGQDGEKIERPMFGHGGKLTEEQIKLMIREAPDNAYFWRLKISPDPKLENKAKNLDLRQLTKYVVEYLEKELKREIPFIAAIHNDHTDIAHVHALLLIQRNGREMLITPERIAAVQELATQWALEHGQGRKQTRELKPMPGVAKAVALGQRYEGARHSQPQPHAYQAIGFAGGRAAHRGIRPLQLCHTCDKPWDRYHECQEELELKLKLR